MNNLLKRLEIIWSVIALGDEHGVRCFVDRMAAERIRDCSHRAILK